jgi:hypothetical protein
MDLILENGYLFFEFFVNILIIPDPLEVKLVLFVLLLDAVL